MLNYIELERLNSRIESDAVDFQNASPFRHIVLDDLLVPEKMQELENSFPDENYQGWVDADHEHQSKKMSCSNSAIIPEPISRLIFELNSGPFITWLEKLTGITNIIPDPHLYGGGLHMTLPGGLLTPHTDFHVVSGRPLYRRLNLLLYFNNGWSESNQGLLELWDKEKDIVEREILPELGSCVIFQTDDASMHGFSKPVIGRRRCSVAMYYYTATEAGHFSGDGITYWRAQSLAEKNNIDWVRLQAQRFLLFVARASSAISWRAAKAAGLLRK